MQIEFQTLWTIEGAVGEKRDKNGFRWSGVCEKACPSQFAGMGSLEDVSTVKISSKTPSTIVHAASEKPGASWSCCPKKVRGTYPDNFVDWGSPGDIVAAKILFEPSSTIVSAA